MIDYPEIYIIDSLSATHIIRVMADYACMLRDEDKSASEIAQAIKELQPRVKVIAALDTLEYLYKGGRLNKASAVVGELANLKPIITLSETGTISVIGKCFGRNKALAFITKVLAEKTLDPDLPVYSIYSYGTENVEKLEQKLESIGISYQARLQLGSTIGTHIGPGAFAVVFVEK
jgi:DegV family protein with EDD domain